MDFILIEFVSRLMNIVGAHLLPRIVQMKVTDDSNKKDR